MRRNSVKTKDDNQNVEGETIEDGNEINEQEFAVGCRLEARDSSGVWYPARVENVDWTSKKILVHFERWSSKFDEWVSMNSSRLRSVQKPAPKKPPPKYEPGQMVLAAWSPYEKYPASVVRALPDGRYEVLFQDGFSKRLLPSKMSLMDDTSGLTKPKDIELGSKQDRRDRKRKHDVAALFRSNKKPRQTETSSSSPSAALPPAVVSESPILDSPKQKTQPPVKSSAPTPITVSYLDGRTETWSKMMTRRSEGKTAGKIEVLFCSAKGKKFRARSDLIRFCEENNICYDPKLFDFSAKGRKSLPIASDEKAPIKKEELEIPSELTPTVIEPPPSSCVVAVAAPVERPEVDEEERRFIGDLEVVVQDGQFICPIADCKKHFRKENLLHMHMKHYHPDMLKFLDYAPTVTDLAYARTVSLEAESSHAVKAVPRIDLRTPEVKRSPARLKESRLDVKPPLPEEAPAAIVTPNLDHEVATIKTEVPELKQEPETTAVSSSLAEVSFDLETPKAPPECDRDIERLQEKSLDSLPVSPAPRKLKAHWKRRPYHRQFPIPADWYGRLGKQAAAAAAGTSTEGSGKLMGDEPGDLVQRNPILNTLLSSRPLAPTLGWRSGWRRRRRGGWNRRRPPRALPISSGPPTPLTDVTDGFEDHSGPSPAAEGSDLSKSPAPLDGGDKFEKLKGNEIINCICQLKEEDGLMIQCDVCQCWQHGHCQGIPPEGDVPESYICSICKDPPKGRSSRKYYNHQDWLKRGVLPTLPFKPKPPSQRPALLKKTFELSGQMSLITRLLHSVRVKLSIAGNKNHPKLWLWARKHAEAKSALVLTPKEEKPLTPKAPEPEKPIDPLECKSNLLDHVTHYHDLLQERLNSLEAQITELEDLQDDAKQDEPVDNCPRTTATVKMLIRDLDTVTRAANLP